MQPLEGIKIRDSRSISLQGLGWKLPPFWVLSSECKVWIGLTERKAGLCIRSAWRLAVTGQQ
jgi:hypothetical protein